MEGMILKWWVNTPLWTMIYDNFDLVYAFWEIIVLIYIKMLAYHSEETLIKKFNFKP